MIYLIAFTISLLFIYGACKTRNKLLFGLCVGLGGAIVVMLAGLRDYSIGIDTANYYSMTQFWRGAVKADSLIEYLKYYSSRGLTEYLFALFIGVIAQTTGEFRVFLILAHTVIITGVYIGAFRQRKYANPVISIALFYLLFYCHSLNIIRQYMAMAIVYAAFADIEKKKYIRYCIAVLLAALIHNTAVISFLPLAYYLIIYRRKSDKPTLFGKPAAVLITGVLVFAFVPLARHLIQVGFLGEKYLYYFDNTNLTATTIVSALVALELLFVLMLVPQIKKRNDKYALYIICSIAYLLFHQLSSVIAFGKRIALYFAFMNITTIGMLENSFDAYKDRFCTGVCIIAIALLYWWYMYVLRGASQTFPYILGV